LILSYDLLVDRHFMTRAVLRMPKFRISSAFQGYQHKEAPIVEAATAEAAARLLFGRSLVRFGRSTDLCALVVQIQPDGSETGPLRLYLTAFDRLASARI
jgi:hypothetical protein